jgi:hypothetical protein
MATPEKKKVTRIDPSRVSEALKNLHVVGAAHLDFEGVAYIKLTRTGAQECFAADVTSLILGGGENAGKYKAQEHLWKTPAMEKWGG